MAYGTANVDVIQSSTANVPVQFNDGNGTQVGTLCRAWVNFNGVSGSVAIRASFNVSSITRNGSGDYTLAFTNALSDANYSVTGTADANGGTGPLIFGRYPIARNIKSTTQLAVWCMTYAGSSSDSPEVNVSIFR